MTLLLLLDLVLEHLGLDLEVGKLLAQALRLDAQRLSLLFSDFDLLFHHDVALDRTVELGFEVLEGGAGVSCLPLEIIVGNLDIAQLELECPVGVAQRCDFLFEGVLRRIRILFGLVVFGLEGKVS